MTRSQVLWEWAQASVDLVSPGDSNVQLGWKNFYELSISPSLIRGSQQAVIHDPAGFSYLSPQIQGTRERV